MVDIPIATILSEEEFALQNAEAGSEMKEVPNKIRFLVEAAPNKESKIATLQNFMIMLVKHQIIQIIL